MREAPLPVGPGLCGREPRENAQPASVVSKVKLIWGSRPSFGGPPVPLPRRPTAPPGWRSGVVFPTRYLPRGSALGDGRGGADSPPSAPPLHAVPRVSRDGVYPCRAGVRPAPPPGPAPSRRPVPGLPGPAPPSARPALRASGKPSPGRPVAAELLRSASPSSRPALRPARPA